MKTAFQFPLSTGDVAALLDTPEHRLSNLSRQNKVRVPNVGGRRIWSAEHVLKAARILGKTTPAILNLCANKPATEGGGA